MKVIFITNYAIFHEVDLWNSFASQGGEHLSFFFVATAELSEDRIKMGYKEIDKPFIVHSQKMTETQLQVLFCDVDIIVLSDCVDERLTKFLNFAKYIFIKTEHVSKEKNLRCFLSIRKFFLKLYNEFPRSKLYLLAASYYAALDFGHNFFPKDHIYKSGYFPHIQIASNHETRNSFDLLWCGRLLDWKRPDMAVFSLKTLLTKDDRYHLTIVGDGPEKMKLNKIIFSYGLSNKVTIRPFEPHDEILNVMRHSSIYLMTSNKEEGWGVVLNEALASGCVCFASSLAGATNFLVNDKKNGFVFSNKNELKNALISFTQMDDSRINQVRATAITTIRDLWSPEIMAKRLLEVCYGLCSHSSLPQYAKGPMSRFYE